MSETQPTEALLCPHCRIGLAMSERQGIEIDYCPKCRGVWLDRGELDKIIERNAQQSPAPGLDAPPEPWSSGPRQGGSFLPETGFGGHGGHGGGHGGYGGDHGNSWLGRLFR